MYVSPQTRTQLGERLSLTALRKHFATGLHKLVHPGAIGRIGVAN
jgi:hypothetical protein